MNSETFDTIVRGFGSSLTRRRFGAVAGGSAASLLGLIHREEATAKKRRRKKCKKSEKRCGKKCVKGICCLDKPCGSAAGPTCECDKATNGKTFCANAELPSLCEQCPAAGCGPTSRCVPESSCGAGITGVCRGVCPT
jgi:hypothetical protein